MKQISCTMMLVFFAGFITVAQNKTTPSNCQEDLVVNEKFSKAARLQAIMDHYAPGDLPGVSMAVYTKQEGWWAGSAGYSKIESMAKMNSCNLQYTQSVSKTYMAVAILKLHEEGKIQLDAPITKYLPQRYSQYIKNADRITIRMLLNHTSGVAEYSTNPVFTASVILTPTTVFTMEEALRCLQHENPQFAPGSKYLYTNTNYTLLAMIADAITGDHAKYITEKIFRPLQLQHTFYRDNKDYLKNPLLTDSYWDILNTGRPANITPLQQANVATMKGDDGIICTPLDAVKFLKAVMEGKSLQDSSLAYMQQWVNNEKGEPKYGMGLIHFSMDNLVGYGHGGGGIGAGCLLLYVPAKQAYVFIATNTGVLFEGLPAKKADEMKNEILAMLFLE